MGKDSNIIGYVFGDLGQLKVIGWFGERVGNTRKYTVECSICKQDPELFGDGRFLISRGKILDGRIPCGCSKRHIWTEDQYAVLCSRAAQELGYEFVKFCTPFDGNSTKTTLRCSQHGEWERTLISTLLLAGTTCPECLKIQLGNSKRKDDGLIIARFRETGAFSEETKFWRSGRVAKDGNKPYWNVYCPECKETTECKLTHLYKGVKSCKCCGYNQDSAYIILIKDDTGHVGIKFGITSNFARRLYTIRTKTNLFVEVISVYKFPSVASCKKAEFDCLQELECGVVLKRDMPDGWTETTWVYNLDKIIEIYERNGGIKIENVD